MSFKKFLVYMIPSFVLLGVALNQVYQVQKNHLSRWKGGGFGMYTDLHVKLARDVKMFGKVGERYFPLFLPRGKAFREIDDMFHEVRYRPTKKNLEKLNSQLASMEWGVRVTDKKTQAFPFLLVESDAPEFKRFKRLKKAVQEKKAEKVNFSKVFIEVWEKRLLSGAKVLKKYLLNKSEYSVGAGK